MTDEGMLEFAELITGMTEVARQAAIMHLARVINECVPEPEMALNGAIWAAVKAADEKGMKEMPI